MAYQIRQIKTAPWKIYSFGFILGVAACGDFSSEKKVSHRSSNPTPVPATKNVHDDDARAEVARTSNNKSPGEEKSPPATEANLSLSWDEKIRAQALGIPLKSKAIGKTLEQIVTGQAAGRDDGQLCSACHNRQEAQGGYGLDVDKNENLPQLDPWQKVGTIEQLSWAGKDGWATKFISNKTKPALLKTVMSTWLKGSIKEAGGKSLRVP